MAMHLEREFRTSLGLAVALTLIALTTEVRAQPLSDGPSIETPAHPPNAPESQSKPHARPWAEGVSAEQQQKAQKLFAAGNEYLDNLGFAKAAETYRQALEYWAHPSIQYNLAIALIKLDQPIDAYLAITQSLRYGAAALESEQYQQALNYQKLLRNQISEIEISTRQDGIEITLDGKLVHTGSGTTRFYVLPGEHQLVASKRGFQTIHRSLSIYSRQTMQTQVRLFTERELTANKRYWKPWKPWAVIAAGMGVGLTGGALHYWGAASNVRDFDTELESACPIGCYDHESVSPSPRLRRGELQQQIAWGSYVAGGLIMAAGIVGLVLNTPRKTRLDRSSEETRITLEPSLSGNSMGIGIHGTF